MRTMYDSIESTVLDLPDGADVYMGYDDGSWPDASAIAARFPGKLVLRATTNPGHNEGQVLDLEHGNATPSGPTGPGWVLLRRASGLDEPIVYVPGATWGAAKAAFARAHVAEPLWLVAAWNGVALIPAGAIGKQFANKGTYDVSLIVDYLPGIDPAPRKDPDVITAYEVGTQRHVFVTTASATTVRHWWQDTAGTTTAWHSETLPAAA